MAEAVEIAKLRLFLKMVAVVDADRRSPNLGLDPLPDIDFNIRCGNTLVGYASEQEVLAAHTSDLFTQQAFQERMQTEMQKVSMAYEHFRRIQLSQHEDMAEFKVAKEELRTRLADFTEQLNRQMYSTHLKGMEFKQEEYTEYLTSHQPFHWFAEFYQIVHGNGGFDVIIGNPPYVEYNKKDKNTKLAVSDIYKIGGYKTIDCGNLYAFVIERSFCLTHNKDNLGFIVPLTIASNRNMKTIRDFLCSNGMIFSSHYEIRPARLFEGVEQRLTIFIVRRSEKEKILSTSIRRWHNENRELLFQSTAYFKSFNDGQIWRTSSNIEDSIYRKFSKHPEVSTYLSSSIPPKKGSLNYRTAGIRYWIIFLTQGFGTESLSNKTSYFEDPKIASYFMAALNSNLFWWYYALNFDMFNLKDYMIFAFRLNYTPDLELINIGRLLEEDLNKKKKPLVINSKTRGAVTSYAFQKKLSKPIIDEIDKVLAKHYGFTEEELDFIINYDIKYRMGDELNGD